MDAEQVSTAWQLMEKGYSSESDTVKDSGELITETVQRLEACSYGMARVDENRIVPACVQHSVYDERDNELIVRKLQEQKQLG